PVLSHRPRTSFTCTRASGSRRRGYLLPGHVDPISKYSGYSCNMALLACQAGHTRREAALSAIVARRMDTVDPLYWVQEPASTTTCAGAGVGDPAHARPLPPPGAVTLLLKGRAHAGRSGRWRDRRHARVTAISPGAKLGLSVPVPAE